jgi:hypothetical protein
MKSQVRPLGIVHAQCMIVTGAKSPIRAAAAPMPVAPPVTPAAAVPAGAAALAHQSDLRCRTPLRKSRLADDWGGLCRDYDEGR